LSERDDIRKAICAYANDLPGHGKPGVIFVGVKDNGECAHFQITDERLRTLADMRSDGNILPPPLMTVQKQVLRGCELAVVLVSPSDNPPVRYNGRVWIRVGPRLAVATAEEERCLAERRRAGDLPFMCSASGWVCRWRNANWRRMAIPPPEFQFQPGSVLVVIRSIR
jgi:ATP-dependent DNA helicase RecG